MLPLARVKASFEAGSRYPALVCGAYPTWSEPSLWSQPVYTRSVARWKNYELSLASLFQQLRPYGQEKDKGEDAKE